MRTLRILVALLLTLTAAAGCGLLGGDGNRTEDQKLQQILDEHASFVVFLKTGATPAQRAEVEAALRALPGFDGLTFTDRESAYRKVQQMFSAQSERMEDIDPEYLPESFEVAMTDIAAVRKVRDEAALQKLPGVEQVSIVCTTVQECRDAYRRSPAPAQFPPSE